MPQAWIEQATPPFQTFKESLIKTNFPKKSFSGVLSQFSPPFKRPVLDRSLLKGGTELLRRNYL